MMLKANTMPPLHAWQVACLNVYRGKRSSKADFLVVGSVGCGKTRLALEAAIEMKVNSEIDRIQIYTNTTHLVKQWGRLASKMGLNLIQAFGNKDLQGGLPADSHGFVSTYASMGSWPDLHEGYAHGARTLIILDEIHHLADRDESNPTSQAVSVWGDKARQCFASVTYRLALSGTPFRTTGERLPFVEYEEDPITPGEFICKADYTYLYGEAVRDEICRPVVFKPYDAEPEWPQKIVFRESDVEYNVTFEDHIADPATRGARLWASTDISESDEIPRDLSTSKWMLMIRMIGEADRKLQDLRASDHPNAGGIIFCTTADQARGVQKLLKRITKSRVILVLNQEPESGKRLEAYKDADTPWIVSVRMVSEGVDIPRLRVCVYLSSWVALVFFMQVVGRIVRYVDFPATPWGEAYFYYPGDDRLRAYAKRIEEELKQFIRDKKERGGGEGGDKPWRESVHADGAEQDNIASGTPFSPEDIEAADRARRELGLGKISLVELLRFWEHIKNRPRGPAAQKNTTPSYDELRDELRDQAQTLVGRLAHITKRPYDHIHSDGNRAANIKNTKSATLDQLQKKVTWLREQIAIALSEEDESEEDC